MSKSLQRLTMEQNGVPGGQYETGNATDVTGSWFAIQAIESTTINGGAKYIIKVTKIYDSKPTKVHPGTLTIRNYCAE